MPLGPVFARHSSDLEQSSSLDWQFFQVRSFREDGTMERVSMLLRRCAPGGMNEIAKQDCSRDAAVDGTAYNSPAFSGQSPASPRRRSVPGEHRSANRHDAQGHPVTK